MNADINDENPYSRLMALKRMGIVEVFLYYIYFLFRIMKKFVIIVLQ